MSRNAMKTTLIAPAQSKENQCCEVGFGWGR